MDGIHPHFTMRTFFSFLVLILLQTSTEAQDACSVPDTFVQFPENNTVDQTVITITLLPGASVSLQVAPDRPFKLIRISDTAVDLIATRVLDYEAGDRGPYKLPFTCTDSEGVVVPFDISVFVDNENDNPPVFAKSHYDVNVPEMSPIGFSVPDRFNAIDADNLGSLYYTLTPADSGFKLASRTNPTLVVEKIFDYDKNKSVELTLEVRDTDQADATPSYKASTTILVTILDIDNRPPWFLPCDKQVVGGAVICRNTGYNGTIVLNEQEPGVLPLKPVPLYAVDGDSGLNDEITYRFISGNEANLFAINENTGNITMQRPADVLGTIILIVMAAQKGNGNQYATTTVKITVQVKSEHPPKFQFPEYKAVVTAVGAMALDQNNKDTPLRILATDDDYAEVEGVNPHVTYTIKDNNDFAIVNGYLFMIKEVPDGTVPLEIVATDTTNDQSDTAQLSVDVKTGLATTTLPPTTEGETVTPSGEPTTDSKTTGETVTTVTPGSSVSPTETSDSTATTGLTATSEASLPTGEPTTNDKTTGDIRPTDAGDSTAPTVIPPSGGYGPEDLAILGAVLGVLLFVCLVVIGVLVFRMQRGKADWKKIYEASMFQSTLGKGSGGQKPGIQYTNDAFQKDEDGDSSSIGSSARGSIVAGDGPQKAAAGSPRYETVLPSVAVLNSLLPDNTSEAGSDKTDSEKGVPGILTKDRRTDEGYKSVWFKEDIDPNAKEEVVIIPDSRENDSEEEDEEQTSREEDEEDSPQRRTPRVAFNESDLDSGLGVKIEDPTEDSDDDDAL